MDSGISRANENKAIKQEAIREYLSARGKVDYILDNVEKLEDLLTPMDMGEVNRIKAATDVRVRLLDKYLPSLKSTELTATVNGLADLLSNLTGTRKPPSERTS
jgi:hypothetical protein